MGWYESCLKPIIEVATFVGVAAALFYQESIIKSQRQEFDRQKIKDRKTEFLSLVTITINEYNQFIEKYNGAVDNGRRGYKYSVIDYLDFLFTNYHESHIAFSDLIIYDNDDDPTRIDSAIAEHITIGRYGHHEEFLRPYLFLIENSLLLLDNYVIIEDEAQNFDEKKDLIRYFFSKLNDYEIHLVMFYCLNEKGLKVKEIIEKYSLFEDKRFFSLVFNLKAEFKDKAFDNSKL